VNLLDDILSHEVFPAVGCTEPISCAYACSVAAERLPAPVERIRLSVDPGTYKNGAAVTIPNSNGQKGNRIAAALGAVLARSDLQMEVLKEIAPDVLTRANDLLASGRLQYQCRTEEKSLYVEVVVEGGGSRVRCILSEGHGNITCLERDGQSLLPPSPRSDSAAPDYRDRLRQMPLEDVLREVVCLSPQQRLHIQRGIEMNLAMAERGFDLKRTASQLQQLHSQGLMGDDLFFRVKLKVASALDARMGGVPEPVMTSGGSGNQGILTVLLPYLVGLDRKVDLPRIQESIALSHALNSYVKRFTGELSVTCGCAIAASIAGAAAIVYQQVGVDMPRITFAVHNVLADLCGIICDGAKPGCSMKIVSGADSAMRSAFMALSGYGISAEDGVIGHSAEESIRNLSRVSLEGMDRVDATVVSILQDKLVRRGLS